MAGTKDSSKRPVNLRIAPAVLGMVDDLREWTGADSKNEVWEKAIRLWHAREAERRAAQGTATPSLANRLIDLAGQDGLGWAGDRWAMDDLIDLLARCFVPRADDLAEGEDDQAQEVTR